MPNVGEEIMKAVKKEGRGRYERAKSEKGGIQDQMNCVYAFMEGYQAESEESTSENPVVEPNDGKMCVTAFKDRNRVKIRQYREGKVQWQISAIEIQAKLWNLSFVQIFQLGEFLYCYCPGFTGSAEDFRRLEQFGRRVGLRGKSPMDALTMAKFDKANEELDRVLKMFKDLGQDVKVEFK